MDFNEPGPDNAVPIRREARPAIERRMVMRLLNYWRGRSIDHTLPARDAIDPDEIPEIWPHCWIAAAGPGAPRFDYVGPVFAEDFAASMVGHPLSDIPDDTLLGQACAYAGDVMARRIPISLGGEIACRDGRHLLYRSIILPLAAGDRVGHLLGAANCRVLTD
jgi:hypothetical protein